MMFSEVAYSMTTTVFGKGQMVNLLAQRSLIQAYPADIDKTSLHLIEKKDLTLMILTSVASSRYDNSGLVCSYKMKFKLLLQKTVSRSA